MDLMTQREPASPITSLRRVALLAAVIMVAWSILFSGTFAYPFYWDDFHFIRPYSAQELASTFHGTNDPDGIETVALRPAATLLFAFQGVAFGEHMIAQRVFMAILMWALLCATGLLLVEAGLSLVPVALVLLLFASSRVFASLVLWLTLGTLIASYTCMMLGACAWLRWVKGVGAPQSLVWAVAWTTLAIFSREEAYTLPAVLPLLWLVSSPRWAVWRRAAMGALAIAAVVLTHAVLRHLFLGDRAPAVALSPEVLTSSYWPALQSSWMPGGRAWSNQSEHLVGQAWQAALLLLAVSFFARATWRRRAQGLGLLVIGLLLCTPALGVARAFGVAMPGIAFLTAAVVAGLDLVRWSWARRRRAWGAPLVVTVLLAATLVTGVASGVRRSFFVVEALHENSVTRVLRDGAFVFSVYGPSTIPLRRRRAAYARLEEKGLRTREDYDRLQKAFEADEKPFEARRASRSALFVERYDYLSF